ncbi:MAG TPA: 2OG-Fe(II) oxygenase [Gammaproteobacteria bacterium]
MTDHPSSAAGAGPNGRAAWPPTRVVARLPGSLPMGGVVPRTPVYTFATTPPALVFADRDELRPRRRDIDLGGLLAFVIDEVVATDEADAIVAASEHFGFREEAPGITTPPGMRLNKTVHWVADEALLGPLFARIRPVLPAVIDTMRLADRLSHRLNVYRYEAREVFNRHTDGDWPGFGLSPDREEMLQWPGMHSCLTMLLYLNGREDGVEGGCTRLYDRRGQSTEVTPRKGSALFFRHGMGPASVVHEGRPVVGATPKYVARINVLYAADRDGS